MEKNPPCQKGGIYTVKIGSLGHFGEGVAKIDGFTVFVPGALPGEVVRAVAKTVKSSYALMDIVDITEPSPDRITPPCPVYSECGGCQLQHMGYVAQLTFKRKRVEDALIHIAGIEQPNVLPTIFAGSEYNYRNKMIAATGGAKGAILLGCYKKGSHDVVDAPDCLLQKEANNIIARTVHKWAVDYKITPYDEKTGAGLLRHVFGRTGGSECMAGIITAKKTVPFLPELIKRLKESVNGLSSILQIVKTDRGNTVMRGDEYVLYGAKSIKCSLSGFTFNISASSFFQVNTEGAALLYQKAIEAALLTGKERVIEAYSGTGTISMLLSQNAEHVYGIELSAKAVADADANARENRRSNITFIAGDVSEKLPDLLRKGVHADIIAVDPPRAGLALKVVESINKYSPQKIVYVSCNPATLARDIALFADYRLKVAQPVDMFPQTSHIETVVELEKISWG